MNHVVCGGLQIRKLTDMESFERCVTLQVAVWGYDSGDVVPRKMFLLASKIGGQLFGAFEGDAMVGFAVALPGYRNGMAYLHSHMLAVLPEYRNRGLGRRLKLAQRNDAIARGFSLMEWTFDPLEIRNAYLNICRLGAIARRYEPDFYGPSSSPLQGGLPTDRLYAEWWLNSADVERHIEGAVEKLEPEERIIVPAEIADWKQDLHRRHLAEAVQRRNRELLQDAFARGLAVIGYESNQAGDGCFLLGRWQQPVQ